MSETFAYLSPHNNSFLRFAYPRVKKEKGRCDICLFLSLGIFSLDLLLFHVEESVKAYELLSFFSVLAGSVVRNATSVLEHL